MTKEDTIAILDKCIEELENMSEEDFNKSLEDKGLSSKNYDENNYENDDFRLVFHHECIQNRKLKEDLNYDQ